MRLLVAIDAEANTGQVESKLLDLLDIPILNYEPDSRLFPMLLKKSESPRINSRLLNRLVGKPTLNHRYGLKLRNESMC